MKYHWKRSPQKIAIAAILLLIGFVGCWYLAVRLMSPLNVVRKITLNNTEKGGLSPSQSGPILRVGCYNIAHGRGGESGTANWHGGSPADKKKRLTAIAELLKQENLDIVVLNEVDFSSYWSGHIDQAKLIARQAGYRYLAEQRNIDVGIPFFSLRFGNVILSRYPIAEVAFLDFPHPSRLQEMLVGGHKDGLVATITLPDNQQIQVAAVHLSLAGEDYRTASIRMIMDAQQQSSLPMITMGDFNSTCQGYPDHYTSKNGENCIDYLLANEHWGTAAIEQPTPKKNLTFPSQNPVRCIGWIFATAPCGVESLTVLPSELSDHRPVTAVIHLNRISDHAEKH